MKILHRLALPLLAAASVPALAAAATPQAVPALAGAPVNFEVFLPLRNTDALKALLVAQQTEGSPSYHKWLTPAQFAARFGPTADAMSAAKAAMQTAGLSVTETNTRSFHVSGNAATVGKLFATTIGTLQDHGAARTVAMTRPTLPAALTSLGAHVVSFSGLPSHRPFAVRTNAKVLPDNRYGADGPYWFTDLKQAYNYPSYESYLPDGTRLDGTGVHAAVLMADKIRPADLQAFFDHEHFTDITGQPAPTVNTVEIDGGGVKDGYGSFEASLDVQQITGGAPGAKVTLISLPDLSDDSIVDGYNYIVNKNNFDVVNSSFGVCELVYLPEYNNGTDFSYILRTYEEIFQQGNAQGITFAVSSGDNGGLECPNTGYVNKLGSNGHFVKGVSSPASSGYVTAVGGGNLVTVSDGTLRSNYVSENGYGDPLIPYDIYGTGGTVSGGYWGAGGGVSRIFTQPGYQYGVNTGSKDHRTLPDIGMQVGGCPGGISQEPCGPDRSAAITAYDVGLGGGFYGVIGTSVSSPEFVGALALYMQKTGGRVGNINYYLYKLGSAQTAAGGLHAPAAAKYYHRDIPGFDGVYRDTYPSVNYNYIVGNGTPDVRKLFGLEKFPNAGRPQTPSNP